MSNTVDHWTEYPALKFVASPKVGDILLTLISLYFVYIGLHWTDIKSGSNFDVHQYVFMIVALTQVVFVVFRAVYEKYHAVYSMIHKEVLQAIGKFSISLRKNKAEIIFSNDANEKPVLSPETYINDLLKYMAETLSERLNVPEEELDIHIIGKDNQTNQWEYLFGLPIIRDDRSTAENVMNNCSVASEALATENSVFHPDKKKIAGDSRYLQTPNDLKHGTKGSIYCEPLFIGKEHDVLESFVVSIKSYGPKFSAAKGRSGELEAEELCECLTAYLRAELFLYRDRES